MLPLRKLAHKYGFTESEARAVLLITAAALTGALVHTFAGTENSAFYRDEYRRVDSVFAAQLVQQDANADTPEGRKSMEKRRSLKMDLNTATAYDFESLPGIGPVIGQRIVEYRTKNGGFKKLDDLIKVKSIGKKKFEQIEPYICIGE